MPSVPVAAPKPAPAGVADEYDEEVAVWQDKDPNHQAPSGEPPTWTTTDGLLCCLRSRCLGLTCVLAPFGIFFLLFLCTKSSSARLAFLVLALVPLGLYGCTGVCLVILVCWRQIVGDMENAQTAHRYIQARANIAKVAVSAGHQHVILGRFAMFLEAAKANNVETVRWCIQDGQWPDETDNLGRSALHWASMMGADDVVTILLQNGASIDLADRLELSTPLHYAAYYGNIKTTRQLVASGANLLLLDGRKLNPLQLAEMASLKITSVQPSHQMIIKYLRIAMKDDVTPALEHTTGLTVLNLIQRETITAQHGAEADAHSPSKSKSKSKSKSQTPKAPNSPPKASTPASAPASSSTSSPSPAKPKPS